MKTKISIILSFITFIALHSKAQHCPFDGTYIILVKLSSSTKKYFDKNTPIHLTEVDNAKADSCAFAKGLINKKFLPIDCYLKKIVG